MPVSTEGVMIPRNQLIDEELTGSPMSITHAVPMQMVGVQWFDERGQGHNEIWFVAGNAVYQPPNAEEWASQLKPVKDDLRQAILSQLNLTTSKEREPLPMKDEVDVIADEVAG